MKNVPPLLRNTSVALLAVLLFGLTRVAEATLPGEEPDLADVAFGPDRTYQLLDIFFGDVCNPNDSTNYDSTALCPTVVWWHRGGFNGGSRSDIASDFIDALNARDITVVSADHRRADPGNWFCPGIAGQTECGTETGATGEPLPVYNYDGALAVSFLKDNSRLYQLDPDSFYGSGKSSGAAIATWVAYHDDVFANDPTSSSSKLEGVAVYQPQTNLNPLHHASELEIFRNDNGVIITKEVHNYFGLCQTDPNGGPGESCDEEPKLDWEGLNPEQRLQYTSYFLEGSADTHVDSSDYDIPVYFIYSGKDGSNSVGNKDCADTREDGSVQTNVHCPDVSIDHRQSLVDLGIGCKFVEAYSGSGYWIQQANWLINQITGDPNSLSEGEECYCALCEGDADGDCDVTSADVLYVIQRIDNCDVGQGDEDCNAADVNGDGLVNDQDSGYVHARLGSCEPDSGLERSSY